MKSPVVNVTVGRESVANVEESGFSVQQFAKDGQPFRWTDGSAKLVIPIDRANPPFAVKLRLWPWRPAKSSPASLRIGVNGRELFSGRLAPEKWEQTFHLAGINLGDEVVLEIVSDTFVPNEFDAGGDTRILGVQVNGITLLGPAKATN